MSKRTPTEELEVLTSNSAGSGSESHEAQQHSFPQPIKDDLSGQPSARKSTGPRTAQGKERSKLNALKHGLLSKVVLLKEESRTEYLSLCAGLCNSLQPEGFLEDVLVENVAALLWRKRRLLQAENAEISEKRHFIAIDSTAKMLEVMEYEIAEPGVPEEALEKVFMRLHSERTEYKTRAAIIPGQEVSERLLRYETHFSREIDRTLNQLEHLQRKRHGHPPPPSIDVNIS